MRIVRRARNSSVPAAVAAATLVTYEGSMERSTPPTLSSSYE